MEEEEEVEEEEGELTSSIGGALQLVAPKAKGGLGVGRESVVLFGQSIGCAVAIEMARTLVHLGLAHRVELVEERVGKHLLAIAVMMLHWSS